METFSVNSSTDSARKQSAANQPPGRVISVDALRGFDMFWIIGGEQVARALEGFGGGPVVSAIAEQLRHVEWAGFHFFDGIFPLFLFLTGVSIVFSLERILHSGGRLAAVKRIVRRSVLLFGLGVFYYGGVSKAWPDVALSGVLPRIAICYLVAALLCVWLTRRSVAVAAVICLVSYWAAMTFVPLPDVQLKHETLGKKGSQLEAKPPTVLLADVSTTVTGTFEEGHNLAHYVDYRWLPGRKRNLYYTNEGLLSTLPALATTLFGVMAGWLLVCQSLSGRQKVARLLCAGLFAISLGMLWSVQFPIIKRIWTSSFCLVASGFACILLGVFYLLVDVWNQRKWCEPFVWIGSNALVLYLCESLVDFEALAARFTGGDVRLFLDGALGKGTGNLVTALVALILPVLLARFLYERRIFIRL